MAPRLSGPPLYSLMGLARRRALEALRGAPVLAAAMACALLAACSDSVGPDGLLGTYHHLVSVNGEALPHAYLTRAGEFIATVTSATIAFFPNGYVRAEQHVHSDYADAQLPDENAVNIDSVPYRIENQQYLIKRIHGWDIATVEGAIITVNWTTSAESLGAWRYVPNE